MSEYKRLTKKSVDDGTVQICCADRIAGCYHKDKMILERLAELEDKIEQGKMIELPCKVGDTCYLVYKGLGDMCRVAYKIKEVKIDNIHYIGDNEFFTETGECSSYTVKFGEEIFTTREEAEKRLKELQNG